MKCTIPGTHVKIFGKAVHSLSKIGEELYFEPLENGLALRTVNASRSAYACFVFAPSFFIQYDDGTRRARHSDSSDQDENPVKCKVGVKSCLTVFKSLATLEKTVDRCKITLDMEEARLVFQLYCRHGIVKTHNLAFIECETLQAVFSKDMTPNKLTAQSRLLCDAVVNFQTNQEEVTLCVNPEKVVLRNYVDDEPDPHKVIRTELGMDPDEFENYQVGIDTDVTFCLKELRAILAFSESANLPVSVNFETAGRPIIFCVDGDSTFEANFVLATLAEPSISAASTQQSTQTAIHDHTRAQNNARSNHTLRRPSHNTPRPATQSVNGAAHNGDGDSSTANTNKSTKTTERKRTSHSATLQAAFREIANENSTVETDDPMEGTSSMCPQVSSLNDRGSLTTNANDLTRSELSKNGRSTVRSSSTPNPSSFSSVSKNVKSNVSKQGSDQGSGDGISPDIPVQVSKQGVTSVLLGADSDETASEEEDLVPGTPPAKKFKSIFFGLSQNSTQASQPLPQVNKHVVLAEDTDEED